MQKYKNFFDYLFETVELNPVISKDENILPFSPETEKLFRPRNIKEEPLMSRHYQSLSGKEMKSEKFRRLSKERNILKKHIKQYEISKRDQKEFLFEPITLIKNDQEWLEKIQDLKIVESEIESEKSNYQKNLGYLVKKFFSIGGKMPRRYLYLPLSTSNMLNVQQIEKLNYTSPIDVFRKIRGGNFLIVDESHNEIIDYLKRHGYRCDERSYIKNECVNENGKTIPIDMELKRISEIDINNKLAFIAKMKSKAKLNLNEEKAVKSSEADIEKRKDYKEYYVYKVIDNKENINLFLNHVIVLTWVPRLIMSQSSNTVWKSCMRYFLGDMTNRDSGQEGDEEDEELGGNVHFVPGGIKGGVFVAWLVDLDDKKIRTPKARILMKPYQTNDNKTFYWPSTIYSTGGQKNIIDIFAKTMKLYALNKQRDTLNKGNRADLQIGLGVYHDNDDISKASDVMSQPELIRKITSRTDDYFASVDLESLFSAADYTSRGIEVFIKNKKIKNQLLNDNHSHVLFYKLLKGMIVKKEFRLINILFNFFKQEKKINVFFDKLANFISKSFSYPGDRSVIDKNTMVYLYKSLIIPNIDNQIDVDLMSVKYIISSLYDRKLEDLYNKTVIDDMIDIVPSFFDNLGPVEFKKIFFLLKTKTLEKVLARNPKYRETVFDFYLPNLFKEHKDKFYFFINNFKIDLDAQNETDFESMMMATMIDIFRENINTISYKDLIDFLQLKHFNFSENVQEELSFELTQYPYITIISRFNENEIDNIFKIGKSRGFDIERIYLENSTISRDTIKLLYDAFQNKGFRIEKEIERVLNFIRDNPKSFTDLDLIQQFSWQLQNKKQINYDFLNKIAKVLAEANNFNDKKSECIIFVDNLLQLGAKDPMVVVKEKNKLRMALSHFTKSPNFWPYILRESKTNSSRRSIEKFTVLYLFPEEFVEKTKNINFYDLIEFNFNRERLMQDFDLINLIIKNKIKVVIDKIQVIDSISFEGKFILHTFKKLYENKLIANKIAAEDLYYDLKMMIQVLFYTKTYEKKETKEIIDFYKKLLQKTFFDESKSTVFNSRLLTLFYDNSIKEDYFRDLYFDFLDDDEKDSFIKYFFEESLIRYDFRIKDIEIIISAAFDSKNINFTEEKLTQLINNSINKNKKPIPLIVNLLQTKNARDLTKQLLERKALQFFNKQNYDLYVKSKSEHLMILLRSLSLQKITEIINCDKNKYENIHDTLVPVAKQIIEGIK